MPFFQVDDQLPVNHKVRTLVESALDGHIEGMAAGFLWTLAGAQCQSTGTDGVVSRADLVRIALNPEIADRLAALLVDVGLWHRTGHHCDRCPPVQAGTYLFHDWFDLKYTPAQQVRTNRRKRQELKDPQLIAQVWARDCLDPADPTLGGCRYCGASVKRKDTKSAKRPHLDHVDPRKTAGIRNVVLACHECNQRKGNRTPREAGMTLLPPPRPEPQGEDNTGDGGPNPTGQGDSGPLGPGSSRPNSWTCTPVEANGSAGLSPTPPDGDGRARSSTTGDDAGPTPGDSRPVEHTAPAVDDRPPADHPPDHSETTHGPPGRPHRKPRGRPEVKAVPRGCGPGQGQGQGSGWGVGKGEPQPPAPGEPRPGKSRRRRRRRSRTGTPPPENISDGQPESLDAGPPPAGVQPPGDGFGSPYWRWRGPPSQVDETDCAEHGLPEPCWKCQPTEEDP